jgi:hypothetical protein
MICLIHSPSQQFKSLPLTPRAPNETERTVVADWVSDDEIDFFRTRKGPARDKGREESRPKSSEKPKRELNDISKVPPSEAAEDSSD